MGLMKIMVPVFSMSFLMGASGEAIYQKQCASCHGTKAEKKAMGHSTVIKGMETEKFISQVKAFASGEKQAMPIAKIVKKQFIDKYDEATIKEVAAYVNKL
jgi:cytochrome c553